MIEDKRIQMKPTAEEVEHEILKIVDNGPVTPAAVNKKISKRFGLKLEEAKPFVKRLITAGELAYSDRHGRTILEKSFAKPVRISNRVILAPPGSDFMVNREDVLIEMAQGASFGNGQHPSTRLAVRAVEHVLSDTPFLEHRTETIALDIGTGTGVLAITALRLGIKKAVAIDTDPSARYESLQNARLNNLEKRFEVLPAPLENIRNPFDMILANLRFPTLIRISSNISTLLKPLGVVVLSGIKIKESEKIISTYQACRFACRWKDSEKGWCSLIFQS